MSCFGRSQKTESVPVGKRLLEECHPKAIRSGQSKVSASRVGEPQGLEPKLNEGGPCLRIWYGEERFCAGRLLGIAAVLVLRLVVPQCLFRWSSEW